MKVIGDIPGAAINFSIASVNSALSMTFCIADIVPLFNDCKAESPTGTVLHLLIELFAGEELELGRSQLDGHVRAGEPIVKRLLDAELLEGAEAVHGCLISRATLSSLIMWSMI